MMEELMDADGWIDEEWIEEEEWIEDSWMELEKARGEKVIKCSKRKIKASKNKAATEQVTLIFEDTDNLDIEETYGIKIIGSKVVVGQHTKNNTVFKEVAAKNINEKRFLEYVAGQIEDIDGPELKLTLAFEKGYSIEITDYVSVEEQKNKP
ncbi:MAG: hypothetical protein NKF70_03905 [Methanobacterium sp. ERen5]|nr:MAG: hypothetical protein NKF70_03905 [Methanobacterium sp. ERen5]